MNYPNAPLAAGPTAGAMDEAPPSYEEVVSNQTGTTLAKNET